MIRALLIALILGAAPLRADPVLSIAGTLAADRDYGTVLAALDDVQADATSVTLFWDEMEVNGTYAPPFDWPAISNFVYPGRGLQVSLMIAVVDTVADRRPADLRGLAYDDPVVQARFATFLTEVLSRMPAVDLVSIGVGNEVDGVLQGEDWAQYAAFFAAARDVAHRARQGVPVGMTLTWAGLTGPSAARARALADLGDVWMVNYYPLLAGFQIDDPADLPGQLDAMLQAAHGAQVYLTEVGYPSGGCGATETGQLAFTQTILAYADAHADRIPLVNLVWLHDLSPAEVDQAVGYYGVGGNCFAAFVASLGLRSHDGADKPVFAWLRQR